MKTDELIKIIREGCPTASDKARRELQETMHKYVCSIVHKDYEGFDYECRKDLIQEGMMGVGLAIDRYNPEKGAFSTFCTPWIHKLIRMYIRQVLPRVRKPNWVIDITNEINFKFTVIDESHLLPETKEDKELKDHQQRVIDDCMDSSLTDLEKEIVELNYYHKKTQKEIAQMFNCSNTSIAKKLKVAIDKLKECCNGE